MIVQVLQTLWWFVQNPQAVLYGWAGVWLALLYASASTLGPVNALQFAITGMFNLSSAMGLFVPAVALGIMYVRHLGRLLIRGIVGLFRAVQRQMISGAKDAGKALAKAKNAVAKATKRRLGHGANGGAEYLGSTASLDELGEALDELADALEMYQGLDMW